MSEENLLYSDLAAVYAQMSRDRDFRCELAAMGIAGASSQDSYCELFAGPAYHSVALMESGWTGELYAVDRSARMREVAIEAGFGPSDNYIVADAVVGLQRLVDVGRRFDFMTIMRFSVGLIPPRQFYELIRAASDALKPGGRFFLEVHRPDLLVGNLEALDIRERVTGEMEGGTIACVWPSGPIRWDRHDWHVVMPILVIDEGKECETISEEWIYSRREIDREATLNGLKPLAIDEECLRCFPQSNLVGFVKRS